MTLPFTHGPVTALIQRQLITAFVILWVLMTAMAAVSGYGLYYINNQAHEIVDENNRKLALANTMLDALQTRRYSLFIYAQLEDPFDREELWEEFNNAASDYLEARNNIRSLPLSADEMLELDKLDQLTLAGQPKQLAILDMVEREEFSAARQYLLEEARPAQDLVINKIKTVVALQKEYNRSADAAASAAFRNTFITIVLIGAGSMVFGLLLATVIVRSIAKKSSEVEHQQRKFKSLFEASHDAVLLWHNSVLIEFNEAAEQTFLLHETSDLKLHLEQIMPDIQADGESTRKAFFSAVDESIQNGAGYAMRELMLYRTDKTPFPAELHISVLELDNEKVLQTVIRDITERKRAEEEISWLAYYDSITDLPNESLFYDRLQMALDLAERYHTNPAILSIRLDEYERIHDSFGRQAGYDLLKHAGKVFSQHISEGDTIARTGTNEFTLLLNQSSNDDEIMHTGTQLAKYLSSAYTIDDNIIHPRCHIGVSRFPEHGKSSTRLMEHARAACKQIKDVPHETIRLYNSKDHKPAFRQLSLSNNILSGIEKGEFYIAYQPKYETHNRQVKGVEALCRWQHPKYGLLMPDEFIPLAEENGSIIQLGQWVLEQSLKEIVTLEKTAQKDLSLAVNLSVQQCIHPKLVNNVLSVLGSYKRAGGLQLEFEVTESLPTASNNDIIHSLGKLRANGIKIAIDDFGTGYSGLSQMHDLPIDVLKIDKSFVLDLEDNAEHREIITMIISLGHRLGLQIVAEGVETQVQYDYLAQHGCELVQGFYLGKPMKLSELFKHMGLDVPDAVRA